MNFHDLAIRRFSCRQFLNDPIDEKVIQKIVEAGRVAPSAVNFQPWIFLVITEPHLLDLVKESYARDWIKNAPAIIIVIGDHEISWKRKDGKDHLDIDASIAIDHMTLQATELGIGSCWVCNFNAEKLTTDLKLSSHLEPIAMIPLGYSNDKPDIGRHQVKRKPLTEIVWWNKINLSKGSKS